MKRVLKNPIFMFIIGAIIFSGITGVVASNLASSKVVYDNTTSGSSKTTVQDAIDDLYEKAKKPVLTTQSQTITVKNAGDNPTPTKNFVFSFEHEIVGIKEIAYDCGGEFRCGVKSTIISGNTITADVYLYPTYNPTGTITITAVGY